MKKTLLAAAIAVGFAGAAGAQTSVTLYGVVDGGFGYTQFKDKNLPMTSARASALATRIEGRPMLVTMLSDKVTRTGGYGGNQQGPRWGLRGSEDLGGGLRALFQLENGFDLFTGTHGQGGRMFGRQAWLALQGDSWGTIKYGRGLNFASQYVAGVAGVYDDAFGEGHIGATFTSTGTVRYDNLVSYETPSFAGFQFGLGYSFQNDGPQPWDIRGVDDTDQTAFTTALRYTNGPLAVAASYDVLSKRDNVTGDKAAKSWVLGASYDFDVVRLHVGFGQDKDGVISGRGPGMPTGFEATDAITGETDVYSPYFSQSGHTGLGYKTNNYAVGVAIPAGAGSEVSLNWQSARLGSGDYKDLVTLTGGKRSQNLYTVVYTYDLSKRTNLYAFGTYGTGYAFNDVNVTQAVVGLRHRF